MSGIISAANRKMLSKTSTTKSSTPTTTTTNKKSEVSSPANELEPRVPISRCLMAAAAAGSPVASVSAAAAASCSAPGSRRNSESVIHGAMAIATAVPHLMGVANASSVKHSSSASFVTSSATNIPEKIRVEFDRNVRKSEFN